MVVENEQVHMQVSSFHDVMCEQTWAVAVKTTLRERGVPTLFGILSDIYSSYLVCLLSRCEEASLR